MLAPGITGEKGNNMIDIIKNVLMGLLQLAVIIVSGFISRYLYDKNGAEVLQKFSGIAKDAVLATEQTMKGAEGTVKKRAVEEYLSRVNNNKLSGEEIDKLIEAAVYEMNLVSKEQFVKVT